MEIDSHEVGERFRLLTHEIYAEAIRQARPSTALAAVTAVDADTCPARRHVRAERTGHAPSRGETLITIDGDPMDDSGCRALRSAVRHLNAPLSHPIRENTALEWLRDGKWPEAELVHVAALLEETDADTLMDLVLARATTFYRLAVSAGQLLAADHPTRLWIDEHRHG